MVLICLYLFDGCTRCFTSVKKAVDRTLSSVPMAQYSARKCLHAIGGTTCNAVRHQNTTDSIAISTRSILELFDAKINKISIINSSIRDVGERCQLVRNAIVLELAHRHGRDVY